MSDFAEHWAYRMMPAMRRRARLIAIRIVTAADADQNWETFNAGLEELEQEAHRLGASHMPDGYQRALHNELRRELVDSLSVLLIGSGDFLPWHVINGISDDCARWERRIREWAGLREPEA